MTTPAEPDYPARAELIELMCRADPDETVPLELIVRMARTVLEAGWRGPGAGDD
jgi:hypothetical protein